MRDIQKPSALEVVFVLVLDRADAVIPLGTGDICWSDAVSTPTVFMLACARS